jgi:signal transduction histidine kinase
LVRLTLYGIAGYIVMRITSAARQQRNDLARRNRQLAQYVTMMEQLTVARERNRLARELHDTLAHTLSAVSIQLKALDVLMDHDVPKARKVLGEAHDLTQKGLQEARRSLQALRARPIDELGLGLALAELAQRASERAGLALTMDIPTQIDGLTPDHEQQIYRITEEALNNVVRHANARALSVRWAQKILTIADDGCGFAVANATDSGHYGLTGMKERAHLIDAALTITAAPGEGTKVTLEISP